MQNGKIVLPFCHLTTCLPIGRFCICLKRPDSTHMVKEGGADLWEVDLVASEE